VLLINCDADGTLAVDDDFKKTVSAGDTVRVPRPSGQHIVRLTSGSYYDQKTVELSDQQQQLAVSMQLASFLSQKNKERETLGALVGAWVFPNEGKENGTGRYYHYTSSGLQKNSSDSYGVCHWTSTWNLTIADSSGRGQLSRQLTGAVENNPSWPKQTYTAVRCQEFDDFISRASKVITYDVAIGFSNDGTLRMQATSTSCTGDCMASDKQRAGDMTFTLQLRTPTQLGFWNYENGWRIFQRK
jgi:hypothetical protein